MSLREKIKAIIEEHAGSSGAAAAKICVFLDDEIGLSGNGWFDDDPEMEKVLAGELSSEDMS